MAFEKVEIDTWKPQEANDEIVGILMGAESEVGVNKSMLYSMDVEGKPVSVWGSTVLDPKMNAVKPGDLIKIVFTGKGEAKGGHNAPKLFDVYIDQEHRAKNAATPVEAPAAPAA